MEFIVENWYVIVTGIVFIVGGVMAVLRWRNLSTDKKYEQIASVSLGWQRSCHLKPLANTLMTPSAK